VALLHNAYRLHTIRMLIKKRADAEQFQMDFIEELSFSNFDPVSFTCPNLITRHSPLATR
jgi:hypothetical protein